MSEFTIRDQQAKDQANSQEGAVRQDSFRVFDEGDEYFESLLQAVRAARQSISLEYYTFCFDEVGTPLLEAMAAAVERGLSVKLLIDGVGSLDNVSKVVKECLRRRIEVKVFHPLPLTGAYLEKDGSFAGFFTRFFHLLGKANSRTHRKIGLIDEQICFVGGMNISRVHSRSAMGSKTWRDISVRIDGEEAGNLVEAFELAWQEASAPEALGKIRKYKIKWRRRAKSVRDTGRFLLNDTRQKRRLFFKQLCSSISESKDRVYLSTPYLNPKRDFIRALYRAAKNGVDVRILLPAILDVRIAWMMNKNYYGAFLSKGVRIFEYQPCVMHSKMSLIDKRGSLGSTNLNMRSLVHDLEIQADFEEPEVVGELERIWSDNMDSSKEVTLSEWKEVSVWKRLLYRSVLVFRRWL